MSDLHGDIMNIPCDKAKADRGYVDHRQAYRYGHRDARHAAAELVAAHEADRAQPAEAEVVEVVGYQWLDSAHFRRKIPAHCIESHWRPLMPVANHQRILSAVTAERDRLLAECVALAAGACDGVAGDDYGHTYCRYRQERDQLRAEFEVLRQDAERYRWLRQRLVGASFDWDDEGMAVLAFEMPDGVSIGADCDKNIEAARAAKEG